MMLQAPIGPPVHLRHISLLAGGPGDPLGAEKNIGGKRIKFVNPNTDNYDRNIRHAADLHKAGMPTYTRDMFKGRAVAICGSGPTLSNEDVQHELREWVAENDAILVACKKAIKVLYDAGFKVDWGVSMDPGDHIACPERIFKAPGVKHLIASSSDPKLFEYLEDEEVVLFHSATGYAKEVNLYEELFDNGDCMGGGYNVINRALSAFMYMGGFPICMAGVDSGWRDDEMFYADGTMNRPGVDMCDNGLIDGRPWNTRPDMLASGVALSKVARDFPENKFLFLGDVMPKTLRTKDDEFLARCASFE